MSWTIARLGSRFGLLFEPYRRRVMHSAMGRFLDQPVDLMVGMEEPDGTRRVLPLSADGELLSNCEQFERVNSITFRGYSEKYNLRFEFNVHSVFYPQSERLCLMPAIYLEMRVNPVKRVRGRPSPERTPEKVKLFIRLRRPNTQIEVTDGEPPWLDLSYDAPLTPQADPENRTDSAPAVPVRERLVSLNPDCTRMEGDTGLTCELPVTEVGSGIKWRLVWGAHVAEPVLNVTRQGQTYPARFRYCEHWSSVDEVIEEAVKTRDDRLAHSRRFEKLVEQAPLDPAERHLVNQSFQSWLSNTFWCQLNGADRSIGQWFSTWDGCTFMHSPLDVGYNESLIYLSIWPKLLEMQLDQWAEHTHEHAASEGVWLSHDMGSGSAVTGQAYPHAMEVEENCNYLLLLQACAHWTGDRPIASRHAELVAKLAKYLIWTDRDKSGFPSAGVANAIDDAGAAVQYSNKQTYLGVKRVAALRAAGDLLAIAETEPQLADECDSIAEADLAKIERKAWLGDHYAVSVEPSAAGVTDVWSGKPVAFERLPGWDAYSIYTGNGTLLPMLIGQPPLLDPDRLRKDTTAALRENVSRYGCGHTSIEPENVWVSQNLWRDLLARYLNMAEGLPAQYYWDMEVMSNSFTQSLGYVDTYIGSARCFSARGITSIGYYLAGPRLIVDRLAAAGAYITVEPDRDRPQRWPLLPLADWKAGKIPVCVVSPAGRVTIEGEIDPIVVHGETPEEPGEGDRKAGLIG
ncbi:MAG: glutaminase domain-containing protein [Phycisphaeraceae bacterium]